MADEPEVGAVVTPATAAADPEIQVCSECPHWLAQHYPNGCGWCICKVAGTADEATTTAAQPLCCDHGKTAMEDCGACVYDDDCPADVPGAGHDPTPNGRECRNCWAVLDAHHNLDATREIEWDDDPLEASVNDW